MTLITDQAKLIVLVGELHQRRIVSRINLQRAEEGMAAEVFVEPTESLLILAQMAEEHGLALVYDGTDLKVVDSGDRLGDQTVPA